MTAPPPGTSIPNAVLIFVIIGMVGFFFLIVSALFGGHDVDHGFEPGGHELGHEGASPFSLRVISLFLTAFGATGAIARSYNLGYPLSTGLGMGAGLVVGFVGFRLIDFFMRQQASSIVGEEDLVGALGEVAVAIPAGGLGQVGVTVRGKRMYSPARATGDIAIEEGTSVKVVRCSGNQVFVERV